MKTHHSMKKILRYASLISLLVGLSAVSATALKVGDAAPDFAVLDTQGIQRTMADYRGRMVIVNFWATYCPPCRQEKPSMEQFYLKNKNQGLELLAVTGERKRAIERYLKKYPLSFEVLRDYTGSMHRDYAVLSYPQSFVVDRSGTIVHIFFGPQDWTGSLVTEMISPLLAE